MPRTGTLANRMLSARDVATILAIPEGTVRDKWREWGLPAYKIGKHLRWRERDLYARGLTARPRDMRAGPARHERVSACFRALPLLSGQAAWLHSAYSALSASCSRPSEDGTRCP